MESLENKDAIKAALRLIPTEFRCFNYETDGAMLSEEDMRLKELEPKIETRLHSMAGNATFEGAERASDAEMAEFVALLKGKIERYEAFAAMLKQLPAVAE